MSCLWVTLLSLCSVIKPPTMPFKPEQNSCDKSLLNSKITGSAVVPQMYFKEYFGWWVVSCWPDHQIYNSTRERIQNKNDLHSNKQKAPFLRYSLCISSAQCDADLLKSFFYQIARNFFIFYFCVHFKLTIAMIFLTTSIFIVPYINFI